MKVKSEDALVPAMSQTPDLKHVSEELQELVQAEGEQVASKEDALRRFTAGERLFVMHELDEGLSEISAVSQLDNWTADQVIALPSDHPTCIVQIAQDQSRLWVNASDGSAVARFSKMFGMDIHTTAQAQMDGAKECIACTHTKPTHEDWGMFIELVKAHYGVVIAQDALGVWVDDVGAEDENVQGSAGPRM